MDFQQVLLHFIIFWNLVINKIVGVVLKIKFKEVYRCKCIVYQQQCNRLTLGRDICSNHRRLKRESCKAYHLYNYSKIYNISDEVIAFVELQQRQRYVEVFKIITDWAHKKFENSLAFISRHINTVNGKIIRSDTCENYYCEECRQLMNINHGCEDIFLENWCMNDDFDKDVAWI